MTAEVSAYSKNKAGANSIWISKVNKYKFPYPNASNLTYTLDSYLFGCLIYG